MTPVAARPRRERHGPAAPTGPARRDVVDGDRFTISVCSCSTVENQRTEQGP
jgi:hypothetical protein